jgi:NADH dehydrogenase
MKRVVIIGGGFAGLRLAKDLAGSSFEVTLVDKYNHHMFQPLFYQVATAGLDPSSISFPFRKIFQGLKNLRFKFGEVKHVNIGEKTVVTEDDKMPYDILVLATGCTTNFFGNHELASHAYAMKSIRDALDIKYGILSGFERLDTAGPEEQDALMTVLIVGAGPTGVELAGSFAEMKTNILPKDYPEVDFSKLRIILLEGSAATLSSMSPDSQKASAQYLTEMGVEVRTNIIVTGYDGKFAVLNNGERIRAAHLVWAAGVTGNLMEGLNHVKVERGRYEVDRQNKISGVDSIYALGDVALMKTPKYPKGHPQLANVAIGQASALAKNLRAMDQGKPLTEYEYKDMGSMATVGKHKAVVDLPFIRFQGYIAWFIWMSLHLMLILSVKNKLIIFINWVWSYFTNDSSLRIIINPSSKKS